MGYEGTIDDQTRISGRATLAVNVYSSSFTSTLPSVGEHGHDRRVGELEARR